MNKSWVIVAAAAMLLSCGRSAGFDSAELRNANVLFITLDTTRADRMGAYGHKTAQTPNFDALANDGVLFENCITPSAYTLPSHSSIFTGLYPAHHGVRLNGEAALADARTTLAERLSQKGYRTGAFVGAFVLDGRWGLSQGFSHYDDEFQLAAEQKLDLARVQRPADVVTDAALKWLDADQTRPFFAWVHFYDAHVSYDPPEPYKSRFGGSPGSLYDGEIAFTDSQVGRLLDWVDKKGLSKNTIIVIVGDHGEGLGSHGEGEHGYYVYDYAVHVPFAMKLPGVSRRVPEQVRTIDIFPTVLELVTGEGAKEIQGSSLIPLMRGEKEQTPRYAYSESMATNLQYGWSALYSLRTNDYKFIEAPRAELYDLRQDPGETENRLDRTRRVARDFRNQLTRIRDEGTKSATRTEEANLDQETMRMLASLGYVGGTSTKVRDDKDLADPKDKIHLFDSVGFAANLMSRDDYKQAAEVLEIVLADDPKIPQAQFLLASVYRKTGNRAKARQILDAYLKEDQGNVRALLAMAEILLEEGKRDEVIAVAKRALAEDPHNARAYELMADAHIADRDYRGAIPLLRQAIEQQPKLARSRINLAAALIDAGQTAEADKLLGEITREQPKFPLAWFHLALLREREGRFREARSAYETEIGNQPKSVVARFNLGNLMLRMGDASGAEREMRELIKDDPGGPRPYLLLGQVLLARPGHLGEVETLARAGLERTTEAELKALGYFLLADVYSRQGRRAELQDALRNGQRYRALIKS